MDSLTQCAVGHTAGEWPRGLLSSSVAKSYRLWKEGPGQVQEESGPAGLLPAHGSVLTSGLADALEAHQMC